MDKSALEAACKPDWQDFGDTVDWRVRKAVEQVWGSGVGMWEFHKLGSDGKEPMQEQQLVEIDRKPVQ